MLGVWMRRRSTQSCASRRSSLRGDEAVLDQAAEIGKRDVGGDRQEQHQPFDPPLARDIADAEIDGLGRRLQMHLAAADAQLPPYAARSRRACASAPRGPSR